MITVKPLNDFWFEVGSTEGVQVAVSGSESVATIEDITFDTSTTDTVTEKYTVFPTLVYIDDDSNIGTATYSSSNTGVATINANGVTSYVGNGSTVITVTLNGISRSAKFTFDSTESFTSYDFNSFAAGSARKASFDAINGVIANAADNLLFDTATHPTTYVRNASHWLSSWDMSPIAVYNSRGGTRRGGTLITPRHVLLAAHYSLAVGDTITFVSDDGNNTAWTATVQEQIKDTDKDFQIVLLNAEAATSFNPIKVLPSDFADYMPATLRAGETTEDAGFLLPVVARNQDNKLHLSSGVKWITLGVAQVSDYDGYPFDSSDANHITTIVGDSGSPKMTTFDTSEFVLLFANVNAFSGFSVDKSSSIDSLIQQLDTKAGVSSYNGAGAWSAWPNNGTSYQTQAYDLSSFTNYNP